MPPGESRPWKEFRRRLAHPAWVVAAVLGLGVCVWRLPVGEDSPSTVGRFIYGLFGRTGADCCLTSNPKWYMAKVSGRWEVLANPKGAWLEGINPELWVRPCAWDDPSGWWGVTQETHGRVLAIYDMNYTPLVMPEPDATEIRTAVLADMQVVTPEWYNDEFSAVAGRVAAGETTWSNPLWWGWLNNAVALLCLGLMVHAGQYWATGRRAARRTRRGRCVRCSYDLRGNTIGVCPECGHAVIKPQPLVSRRAA